MLDDPPPIAPPSSFCRYWSVHRHGRALRSAGSPGSAAGAEPEPISWRDDYGGALEEAKGANRLLWIQFTGPWCPNCTRMERDSFPDPEIIQHTRESYVPLKLRSDVHEQLALAFNLSGLPATVIVAPTREIVAVRQGYLGPDELDSLLSEVRAAWRAREGGNKTEVAGSRPASTARPRSGSTQERDAGRALGILPGQPDLQPAAGPGSDRVHRSA